MCGDSLHGYVTGVRTAIHPQTCEKCDRECYSRDSLQKREVNVSDQLVVTGEPVFEIGKFEYEVTHPHTCEKCDKEFYNKDGLQKHMADVHDQLLISGKPVLENRKFEYEVAHPQTCEKC